MADTLLSIRTPEDRIKTLSIPNRSELERAIFHSIDEMVEYLESVGLVKDNDFALDHNQGPNNIDSIIMTSRYYRGHTKTFYFNNHFNKKKDEPFGFSEAGLGFFDDCRMGIITEIVIQKKLEGDAAEVRGRVKEALS